MRGGEGRDFLGWASGNDTVDYSDAAGPVTVVIDTSADDGGGGLDTPIDIGDAIGSAFDDFCGRCRLQLFAGGGGDDELEGDAGDDTLDGGDGTDHRRLRKRGGEGVTISLAAGTATGDGADTLIDVENVVEFEFADAITGNAAANELTGGLGNDTLLGGAGDDTVDGGAGIDTADYSAAAGPVTVVIDTSADDGDGGLDTLIGIENAIGSAFDDLLLGDAGANLLVAGGGDDELEGDAGDDTLDGGAGNDTGRLLGRRLRRLRRRRYVRRRRRRRPRYADRHRERHRARRSMTFCWAMPAPTCSPAASATTNWRATPATTRWTVVTAPIPPSTKTRREVSRSAWPPARRPATVPTR